VLDLKTAASRVLANAGYAGRYVPSGHLVDVRGAQLTGRNMRAHFTIFPKRPAASGDVERRRGTLKVKRGRPAGPLMKCGWGCGSKLTGCQMRAHFARCPKGLSAPTTWTERPRTNRGSLRHRTHWAPDCAHFTVMIEAAGSL
jgi:hypothetical protein